MEEKLTKEELKALKAGVSFMGGNSKDEKAFCKWFGCQTGCRPGCAPSCKTGSFNGENPGD